MIEVKAAPRCSKAGQDRKITRGILREHIANFPCLTMACV